jgi:flagellar biosynthesis protein FlhG
MSNFQNDQAAGLRRIMAAPKPRVVSILSATASDNQPRMMSNLAASIIGHGSDVLIVHASQNSREASYEADKLPTLLDVAESKATIQNAIRTTKLGYAVAKLISKNKLNGLLDTHTSASLNHVFNELATQYEIILVDATLNEQNMLPIPILNESEIIIQLTRKPESITQAYTLIKQICSELGNRSFGIIVDDATEAQAQIVFRNISQVAKRFMQIELEFFGAIPTDDHINRAAKLGRTVIDAFPLASASSALKKIAQRLDFKHDYTSDTRQALCR